MLVFVLFVLTPTVLGLSQPEQPPGCPFPTGPYVPPKCGNNEYFEVCSFKCPPQTCADTPCDPDDDGCCRNECRCIEGYLRDNCGNCIPDNQCPGKPCPRRCQPTCAVPNPKNCKSNAKCNCKKGNIWSDDKSECIPINECSQDLGCNGDPNAVIMQNPPPCPSTCKHPNEPNCLKLGLDVGCVCKYGYILSKEGGKCILPDKCPAGGNPCGANETFSSCKSDCPPAYCPNEDSRVMYGCDPVWPCPSGCICKPGYRRNRDNLQCILPEECPPVECTRDNESWNRCPSPCFTDSCNDVHDENTPCNTLVKADCNPKCTCKKEFARNDSDVCVPVAECPQNSN